MDCLAVILHRRIFLKGLFHFFGGGGEGLIGTKINQKRWKREELNGWMLWTKRERRGNEEVEMKGGRKRLWLVKNGVENLPLAWRDPFPNCWLLVLVGCVCVRALCTLACLPIRSRMTAVLTETGEEKGQEVFCQVFTSSPPVKWAIDRRLLELFVSLFFFFFFDTP